MPMAAGEVQDPGRNIPRALMGGMLVVMASTAWPTSPTSTRCPSAEVVTSNSTQHRDALPVASKAAHQLPGRIGRQARGGRVRGLGARARSTARSSRTPACPSRWPATGSSSRGSRSSAERRACPCGRSRSRPSGRACWPCPAPTTSSPTACCSPPGSSTASSTSAVFVLRRQDAGGGRGRTGRSAIRWSPRVFLLVSGWLVVNTSIERPVESVAGIVLILAGLPVYAWFHAAQRRAQALAREGGSL